jgi:ABC-type phosphate/phosphonate transport system permease subunit
MKKLIKLPWYFLKGMVKIVIVSVLFIITFFCVAIALPISVGGYKNDEGNDMVDIVVKFFVDIVDGTKDL